MGYGQWGLPMVSPELFGDTEEHYGRVNTHLPLSTVGQSLLLYDSGSRKFTQPTEGNMGPLIRKHDKLKRPEHSRVEFSERRDDALHNTTKLFPCDSGDKLGVATIGGEEKYLAYPEGAVLRLDLLKPEDPALDSTFATIPSEFDKSLPSLHHIEECEFQSDIKQVLFDSAEATRILVRTADGTHIVPVAKRPNKTALIKRKGQKLTSFVDLRGDKHMDCDILGDVYAAVVADGTWRIYNLATKHTSPPIIVQGYDPTFEHLSDWRRIFLFDEGKKVVIAGRNEIRLYTLDYEEDTKVQPTYIGLFQKQHGGDMVMDLQRDPIYPNLLVIFTSARLMIVDTNNPVPVQITWHLQYSHEDATLRISMAAVGGRSVAIVHSQLAAQKSFYTYGYRDPEKQDVLQFVCDPYSVLLLTQTPIDSTRLVEFSDTIVMLYDYDIDGCVVRKLLTSEPSKFQDYRPPPVSEFPGSYPPGKLPPTDLANFAKFQKTFPPIPLPEPVPVAEIAGHLDNLIKTWHKEGCVDGRATLADLGADYTPISIDEFGEMFQELQEHYRTEGSAVRVSLVLDPVKTYDNLISLWLEPTHAYSDQGNELLSRFIEARRIVVERQCRRVTALQTYASCTVRRAREEVPTEGTRLHTQRMLDEWVLGKPISHEYLWKEFGVATKKQREAPTQQDRFAELIASRNAIPSLSISQTPGSSLGGHRVSLAPSVRASQDFRRQSSLAPSQNPTQNPASQARGTQPSQNRKSKRRKTIGGFR